jgi:hypothetical protein
MESQLSAQLIGALCVAQKLLAIADNICEQRMHLY